MIKWQYGTTIHFENDFLCDGKDGTVLIECKMHRMDVNERSRESTLQNDINQLLDHLRALENDGKKLVKAVLVFNHGTEKISETVLKLIRICKEKKLIQNEIDVIGYDRIGALIDQLAR